MKKFDGNSKVRLFTHTDLDGYANYIIARCYFKEENIKVEYCNYDNLDVKIRHFLGRKNPNANYLFITDMSVKTNAVITKLERKAKEGTMVVKLLDHHKNGLSLNKFSFATVKVKEDGELVCGSMLFYRYLINELGFERNLILEQWLKYVNDYDTWLWEDKYHYELPKHWNELFMLYDKNRFVLNVLEKIEAGDLTFSEFDTLLLDIEHGKQKNYIRTRINHVIHRTIQNRKCVIVFAEQYTNELTSAMYDAFPDSEIQIVIGSKGISYRCRNKELDIDLDVFAALYGGGGHEKSAGSCIADEMQGKYLDILFQETTR